MSSPTVVGLRAAGTSFVVELGRPVPRVLHWGADLGDLSEVDAEALRLTSGAAVLNNAPDVPRAFSVWPTEAETWSGTPAVAGHVDGRAAVPRPVLRDFSHGDGTLTLRLADAASGLDVELTYRLTPSGVLEVATTVTRQGGEGLYDLAGVVAVLPLPRRAAEVLDFTGKWCRERSPQRTPLAFGGHVREVRRGKPGADSPYLLTVGEPGFSFAGGEVWGTHVAWSGDQKWFAEQLPEGAGVHASVLGGGELLRPGEVRLAAGESYAAPVVCFAWSDAGLDGLAARFHAYHRARATHTGKPRPLTLNTWEAVYFEHDLDRLLELTELGAKVGVERLVLDDGWFRGRRDDTAGLGDWTVDRSVWPKGLTPLVERVHALGLEFGLWFEPEMVNLDSDLAREHPSWILGPDELGAPSRNQYALNLANPEAYAYLLSSLDALVGEYGIDYLKWDHNRELHEAYDRVTGHAGVRAQTLALYRLLDELRERHPLLEIESCASGGGRVDLGILGRTDRVWASDCLDPLERQAIQRWTAQLIPPEVIGSHVGAERSHTTARVTDLSFRLVTALFGHAGIEADLTRSSPAELAAFSAWAELYQELRPLLHSGRVVRADLPDADAYLHGVVSERRAVFCWARLATGAAGQPGRVRLPGLDASRTYRVRVRTEVGLPSLREVAAPEWFTRALAGPLELPGVVLASAGLPMPVLDPAQALLLDLSTVDRS
ncbi:alpha-galactosidase [Amycolatopsis rhabdoformis]|uniref:alpha-galactosidase n=1 Tax=Amycolatopsis rhabdoformis TaxID=1448059 RepID=A0ABZ1I5S1_9PSEU|nr:alpha-galactosidase [Amycolatopsis rhabdoformis]WSE29730.1 alpha-galactosidase [Amycolatopsis rhabdoformis]